MRRLLTYGTPHNGITGHGGFGNGLLGTVDALLGLEMENFERDRMCIYIMGRAPEANSLAGHFPVSDTFCLRRHRRQPDYPVAAGFSRRLVGQLSDGLVEIDNAVVHGARAPGDQEAPAEPSLPPAPMSAAPIPVPYGMVNSEEGFGNLSRFLFGDARVDGDLVVRETRVCRASWRKRRLNWKRRTRMRKSVPPTARDLAARARRTLGI